MTNILRKFDFYGTDFHWYFDYKPKYYTSYGGIFSILSFILYIVIFIIFGLEDFKRTNPISSISNIPPLVNKTIQPRKQKLYIPWRIMDYGKKFIDYTGVLFPRIYSFKNRYNKDTGEMETFYDMLNYSLCNETSMRYLGKDFLLDLPLDQLYCIDMENIDLGGSWNSDFVNYIRLDLNLCKDGSNYNSSNNNCTRPEYLTSLYGKDNNWFFELLYPSVQFQPHNKTMPIFVIYTSYYYGLSVNSNKVDRVYLQEHIFGDDKGWILNKISNVTYWGISSIKTDYYTKGERDIFRYGSTSRLYSLKLYVDFSTIYYTRKYKKLFEILSNLFPLIRAVSSFFFFITEMLKKLEVAKYLNELIIGNEIEQFKKNENSRRSGKSNKSNNIKLSYNFTPGSNFNVKKKTSKIANINASQILCISHNLNNNNESVENNNNKSSRQRHYSVIDYSKIKYNNFKNATIMNSDIYDLFEQKKPHFGLFDYFKALFLNKIYGKKKNNYLCISKQFDFAYTLFTRIIDISFYITLFQQLEILKKQVIKENAPTSEITKIEEKMYKKNNDI